ncbi:MAG: discoidin domain-containing protein, partial [Lentisphaeria bacterium]
GYVMTLPKSLEDITYYGRGPIENYNDRRTSQFIELFKTTPEKQLANFPKPQDCGNHEEVRWVALTNKKQAGAVFVATGEMAMKALPYDSMQLITARHPHALKDSRGTILYLDAKVTGLGGNSCGQGGPLTHDQTVAGKNDFGFIIRPAGRNLTKIANVSPSGQVPLSITRSRVGAVSLTTSMPNAKIAYSINGGPEQDYQTSIALRDGGKVAAWYKGQPDSRIEMSFGKIESVAVEVIYVSSQEPGGGSAASNLVDGNPNTIWHTMYSVTVAQHPHWVDFDLGDNKKINGFTYLPRQEGTNGNVKDYTIHISKDGKEWGEPVIKGTFPRGSKEQRIMLKNPTNGRFIRFTALSEQNGQDFAAAAEFSVLAD